MAINDGSLNQLTTGGLVFNYASPWQTNSCVRRVIELSDPIRRDAMQRALEETRRRYPQLSLALVKTRSEVHEEYLDAPFVLNDSDKGFHHIGKDSGGHLIAFFAKDNRLTVDYFHAIADDAGMDRFIQSLLFHYLQELGYEPDNSDGLIATSSTEFCPAEGEDCGGKLLDSDHVLDADASGWDLPPRAFKILAPHRGNDEPDYCYAISVPLDEFKAVARASGASPTAVVSTLFGRSLWRRYVKNASPLSKVVFARRPITTEVAVNLRNHFPTQSVRCFTGNVYLDYDKHSELLGVETLFAQQTASIKRANTPRGMLDCYNHSMRTANWFFNSSFPTVAKNWTHKYIATTAMSKGMTYGISNIGKTQLPACLKPYVKGYYSQIPSGLHAYLVSMRSEDNCMTICITSKLKDSRALVDEFMAELRNLDIDVSLTYEGDFYFTRYIQNLAAISLPPKLGASVASNAREIADRTKLFLWSATHNRFRGLTG